MIVKENQKQGSTDWRLKKPDQAAIEGYASALSVSPGEQIDLHIRTDSPQYTLDVFRLGAYGGAGARKVMTVPGLAGVKQPPCPMDEGTGLVQCEWKTSYTLAVPNDWLSGVYLVKMTASSGGQSYISFVVRGPVDRGIVAIVPYFTYSAYNYWSGESLYTSKRPGKTAAVKVSLDRPFQWDTLMNQLLDWDISSIRFLEGKGYPVSYVTDLDVHRLTGWHGKPKGIIVLGHDEYWTSEMRTNLDSAVGQGINLAVWGANVGYWQMRLEPGASGVVDRVLVCYRKADLDPITAKSPTLATTTFRAVGRPENALFGIMYGDMVKGTADMVVENPDHWLFAGTNLHKGDKIPGGVGIEADLLLPGAPPGVTVLFHSPYQLRTAGKAVSDSVIYQARSGAWVFAAGSIAFGRVLDSYRNTGSNQVQTMMVNLLDRWLSLTPSNQ